MGRQAAVAPRVQKWQATGSGIVEATSEVIRAAVDMPSEDENGGSTCLPSSGGASPSASSAELGRAKVHASADAEDAQEDPHSKEQRERWADVVDDGNPVVVFEHHQLTSTAEAPDVGRSGSWATAGKKPKNAKPKPRTERAAKLDPVPPPAPSRSSSEWSVPKAAPAAYKAETRHSSAQLKHHYEYEYSNSQRWDEYSWGASGTAWQNSTVHGSSWTAGTWDRKPAVQYSNAFASKPETFKGHGGGKKKSESFKRGPQVATNMDASRLAW